MTVNMVTVTKSEALTSGDLFQKNLGQEGKRRHNQATLVLWPSTTEIRINYGCLTINIDSEIKYGALMSSILSLKVLATLSLPKYWI